MMNPPAPREIYIILLYGKGRDMSPCLAYQTYYGYISYHSKTLLDSSSFPDIHLMN